MNKSLLEEENRFSFLIGSDKEEILIVNLLVSKVRKDLKKIEERAAKSEKTQNRLGH